MPGQDETEIQTERHPARSWWPSPVVLIILCLTCGVELCLQAADLGWIGNQRWRASAYQYGAFWTGLLDNWKPNYPTQPWVMFVSYQALHASLTHLLGNMLILVLVGRILVARVGQFWFAIFYLISGIGGGLGYALLGDAFQPMVGASGALFGLVGAWKWQDWFLNTQKGLSRKSLILDVLGLIVLNGLFWAIQDGQLAWQAHLGGFLTGWLIATLVLPRADAEGH